MIVLPNMKDWSKKDILDYLNAMDPMYSFLEAHHIQERLIQMFPEHKKEIFEIFRDPFGDVKDFTVKWVGQDGEVEVLKSNKNEETK